MREIINFLHLFCYIDNFCHCELLLFSYKETKVNNYHKKTEEAAREVKKFNKKNPGALEEFEMTLEEVPFEMQEAMLEENPEMYRMMLLNIIAGRHKSE